MKASAIDLRRLGLMLGLALCAFASSSYASSSVSKRNSSKALCAANMNEVRSELSDVAGCNEMNLRSKFGQLPRGSLNGQGLASGYVVEFPRNALDGNFKIKVDGVVTNGEICCSEGGVWSIKGYGVISLKGRELSIGNYRFIPAESGDLMPSEQRSTPRSSGGVS